MHAEPRAQEDQCGGDTRYRTGNPTEAPDTAWAFLDAEHRSSFVGITDDSEKLISSKPSRHILHWTGVGARCACGARKCRDCEGR